MEILHFFDVEDMFQFKKSGGKQIVLAHQDKANPGQFYFPIASNESLLFVFTAQLTLFFISDTSFFISDARYDSYSARRQTDQQESRLLSHLMENYDKEVRPVINASKAVEVRVGITLTQIFDMVSENMKHFNNERLALLSYLKYYQSIQS